MMCAPLSCLGIVLMVGSLSLSASGAPLAGPIVKQALHFGTTSKPLREYAVSGASSRGLKAAFGSADHVIPLRLPNIPFKGSNIKGSAKAAVASPNVPRHLALVNGLNFEGVGKGEYGFNGRQYIPPDTEGVAGTSQYVQWVNANYAIFNKTDGSNANGITIPGNALFKGLGNGCEFNNDGDPIVQFDKRRKRWIFTQFSVSTLPYLQCVAVSTTDDAGGHYHRYAFDHGDSAFNDYGKSSVWPTAVFQTWNIFDGGPALSAYAGPLVCALDKISMYAGKPATEQCFQLDSQYVSLLPSDLDGHTAPPAGSPNYLVSFSYADFASLLLWQFNANFSDPSYTYLTGPVIIPVDPFIPACHDIGTITCAPQPQPQPDVVPFLDTVGDRLMYRFAYRNFKTHESLVVNHAIEVGSTIGIRWYELRDPGSATPTVYQSGTYSPDGDARFMGSIAMDRVGNIALGYSVSGPSTYPGIRYTARAPTDPLGQLSALEVSIQEGMGSQITYSRWGDYSTMAVDPVDDCTFWYTNQYLRETGVRNWHTKIASFSFSNCRAAIPK